MEAFAGFVIGVALTLFTLSKFGCIHVHLDIHTHDGQDDDDDDDAPQGWLARPPARRA